MFASLSTRPRPRRKRTLGGFLARPCQPGAARCDGETIGMDGNECQPTKGRFSKVFSTNKTLARAQGRVDPNVLLFPSRA